METEKDDPRPIGFITMLRTPRSWLLSLVTKARVSSFCGRPKVNPAANDTKDEKSCGSDREALSMVSNAIREELRVSTYKNHCGLGHSHS